MGLLCPLAEASECPSHFHDILGICFMFMYFKRFKKPKVGYDLPIKDSG